MARSALAGIGWALLGVAPGIGAALIAHESVALWASAASACQVFEAGGMLGAAIFVWPAMTLATVAAYALPAALLWRRHRLLGIAAGILLALVLAYSFAATTTVLLHQPANGFDPQFCPAGMPDWWPWWLPR